MTGHVAGVKSSCKQMLITGVNSTLLIATLLSPTWGNTYSVLVSFCPVKSVNENT